MLYKTDNKKSEEPPDGDKALMNANELEMLKKFDGKIVTDFVPVFLLEQQRDELTIEYDSFDQAVDEYFSQAIKNKEK